MTQGTVKGEAQGEVMATVEEIVRAAITLAKSQQIKSLKRLKAKLLEEFPGQPQDVKAAMTMWALQQ